jgi:hypothetical protein
VLADASPAALLTLASSAVVLADARAAALLASASYVAVLADARPPHGLHWLLMQLCSQMPAPQHCLHWLLCRLVVLADARSAALLALASYVVVLERCPSRRIACICFLCSCARRCIFLPLFVMLFASRPTSITTQLLSCYLGIEVLRLSWHFLSDFTYMTHTTNHVRTNRESIAAVF